MTATSGCCLCLFMVVILPSSRLLPMLPHSEQQAAGSSVERFTIQKSPISSCFMWGQMLTRKNMPRDRGKDFLKIISVPLPSRGKDFFFSF